MQEVDNYCVCINDRTAYEYFVFILFQFIKAILDVPYIWIHTKWKYE